LYARPTRNGRAFSAGCRQCQFRLFTRDARNLSGILGLGAHMGEHTLDERQAVLDSLRDVGRFPVDLEIARLPLHRGVMRQIVTNAGAVGCLCCGSRRDGQVRLDRHAKPYFHCMACNEPGIFAYTNVSQELFFGLTRLVADGRLDFDAAADRGRSIWRSWLVMPAEGQAVAAEDARSEVALG
jgi:hypothetical protein